MPWLPAPPPTPATPPGAARGAYRFPLPPAPPLGNATAPLSPRALPPHPPPHPPPPPPPPTPPPAPRAATTGTRAPGHPRRLDQAHTASASDRGLAAPSRTRHDHSRPQRPPRPPPHQRPRHRHRTRWRFPHQAPPAEARPPRDPRDA